MSVQWADFKFPPINLYNFPKQYRDWINIMSTDTCEIHGNRYWIESVPKGAGYCRQCVRDEYDAASSCPSCGTKKGFAWGTGDCDCQDEPDVGF